MDHPIHFLFQYPQNILQVVLPLPHGKHLIYFLLYVFLKEVLGMEDQKARVEAEKMKTTLSDEAINKLAKYVHKVLGLNSLDCNYDINREKCRSCIKRKK